MGKLIRTLHIVFISLIGATVVRGSVKKGVAVNPHNFLCDDLKALNNIAWWYNWGSNLDRIVNRSGCVNVTEHADEHVPMTWGYGSYFSNYKIYDSAEYLLGFNEPNHKAQADLLPEEAARHWSKVEELANGRPIVSPAAASCGSGCNGNTIEWFDEFFKLCNTCRVDYLATHVYKCRASQIMDVLSTLYKRYNRTIWLTEFACPKTTSPARELRLMQELLPLLEEADYVFRYAWYVSRVPKGRSSRFITTAVNLLELNTSNLTTLGQFYNSFNGTSTTTTISTTTFSEISNTTTSSPANTTVTKVTPYNTTSHYTDIYNVTRNNTIVVSDATRNGPWTDSVLVSTLWLLMQIVFYNFSANAT